MICCLPLLPFHFHFSGSGAEDGLQGQFSSVGVEEPGGGGTAVGSIKTKVQLIIKPSCTSYHCRIPLSGI